MHPLASPRKLFVRRATHQGGTLLLPRLKAGGGCWSAATVSGQASIIGQMDSGQKEAEIQSLLLSEKHLGSRFCQDGMKRAVDEHLARLELDAVKDVRTADRLAD